MTLAELVTAVYQITGRPDRVNETSQAIRSATLKAHTRDFFWRDLIEIPIDLGATAMQWTIQYKLISIYWRAHKYLRKFDPTTNTPGRFLDLIGPDNILNSYNTSLQDICYYGGEWFNINSSTADRYYLYGFYNLPDTAQATYNSWIAMDYPNAILYRACDEIFRLLGKSEEAAAYRALVPEQDQMVDVSNISAQGY